MGPFISFYKEKSLKNKLKKRNQAKVNQKLLFMLLKIWILVEFYIIMNCNLPGLGENPIQEENFSYVFLNTSRVCGRI